MKKPGKKVVQKSATAGTDTSQLVLIRKLADLLSETGLSEIELEKGDSRIRVSRAMTVMGSPVVHGPAAPSPMSTGAAPAPAAATALDNADVLKSPMVGTVYLAPSPGAPDFAAIGSAVQQGQTLLIIEAMKTMNQIQAHKSGKVTQVLVENGQPVEFGERLLVIE